MVADLVKRNYCDYPRTCRTAQEIISLPSHSPQLASCFMKYMGGQGRDHFNVCGVHNPAADVRGD